METFLTQYWPILHKFLAAVLVIYFLGYVVLYGAWKKFKSPGWDIISINKFTKSHTLKVQKGNVELQIKVSKIHSGKNAGKFDTFLIWKNTRTKKIKKIKTEPLKIGKWSLPGNFINSDRAIIKIDKSSISVNFE